jgi:hypothetical protein
MKKFTTLKDDLIKESYSAQEDFNIKFEQTQEKLETIKVALDNFKADYQNDLRNWGYSGSMGHVNELLEEILEHLDAYVPKQMIPSDPNSEIQ